MANFIPLKNRFLLELDRSLLGFVEEGRFLDYGCGRADVAAHVLSKNHWHGDLLEVDDTSRSLIREDSRFDMCQLYASCDEVPDNSYDLILLFDVLEHLPEPEKVLAGIHQKLKPGGCLALVIPYRPSTWGWDDDHYGHLRRWKAKELTRALEGQGFQLLQMSDPTYPVYRFLRWAMLHRQKPPESNSDSMQERSQNSPHNNAWKAPPPWTDHLPWNLINHLTLPFNKILMGDEVYTLSIKSDEGLCCDHCNDGGTNSYLDYYDGHVLRECSHCHNRSLKALKSYR